ncbi:hypothetical protein CUMW_256770 [Citrus unshiu]|uniref:Uncharacterized protein n=1 Tax=Citrus unshiu TaxID=55188 RepID=A0A2H5QT68_CITUN|nr:hypothetical protein CUMW_256770 [Citrus unshiu]
MYNSYKVPVGKKRNDLRNYIGEKFKLSLKENTQVFKWMGIALRGFRCKLANEYILPNANNLSSLKKPPLEYEGIRKEDWKSFVDKILSKNFQQLDLGVTEREINRGEAWLLAHKRKDGTYTPEVQQVAERISWRENEECIRRVFSLCKLN